MTDKFLEISRLKSLIKQILTINDAKNLQLKQLQLKNEQLEKELTEKKSIIKDISDKTETLKIAKSISLTEDDKTEVKNKINKIVREIDKSIGLLNE